MEKCKICKKVTNNYFFLQCKYCLKKHCVSCRDPEKHKCEKIEQYKKDVRDF